MKWTELESFQDVLDRHTNPRAEQLEKLLKVYKGVNARLAARLEDFEDSCPHRDMTLIGNGMMECDRCEFVEPDPFYKNPG